MTRRFSICALLFFIRFLTPFTLPVSAAEIFTINSDVTWKSSKIFAKDWEKHVFNDEKWPQTRSPSIGTCTLGKQKPSFTTPMWVQRPVERQTVYFRKAFELSGTPKEARITLAFDDDGELYINEKKVYVDASGKTEPKAVTVDIGAYLVPGKNLFAIKVIDSKGGCQWVQVHAEITIEPIGTAQTPLFLQTDERWKNDIYAGGERDVLDCGTTIEECGCALTSMAMLLRGYGISKGATGEEIQPKSLNAYLLQNQTCTDDGCISLGYVFGALRWSAAHRLSAEASSVFNTPKVQFFGKKAFQKHEIIEKLRLQKMPVIAKDSKQSHWFVLSDEKDPDISVLDPVFGKTTLNTKHEGLAAAVLDFQEVHSDFSAIEIYVKQGTRVTIAGPDGIELLEEQLMKDDVEFPESTQSGNMQHITIVHPVKGTYTLSANKSGVAIYISDQRADEKFQLTTDLVVQIEYDPTNILESRIFSVKDPEPIQACLEKPLPMHFPVIFTVQGDKRYRYKGELVAKELLEDSP